ncbi:MAG: ATP-grasp domain-containing protein, partial [Polyangiales bacterium]
LVLPAFEEAAVLSRHLDRLDSQAELFAPSYSTFARLHPKAELAETARALGVAVPRTEVARSKAELSKALSGYDRYMARPSYSRGGVELFTNAGPLAGAMRIEDCHPTPTNPWVVQEFVDGGDVCSFSVCHHGRIAAHSAYVHPREIEHAGGIVFESVYEPETLAVADRIVRAVEYHGQISFDFRRSNGRIVLLECNPRPTAGVVVMSPQLFVDALMDREPRGVRWAEPGTRRKISFALLRDMVLHWKEAPQDLEHLFSEAKELYGDRNDMLPGLYQLLSYGQVLAYRLTGGKETRNTLVAAYFDGVSWNGEELP